MFIIMKPGKTYSLHRIPTSASYSSYRLEQLTCDSPKSLESSDPTSQKENKRSDPPTSPKALFSSVLIYSGICTPDIISLEYCTVSCCIWQRMKITFSVVSFYKTQQFENYGGRDEACSCLIPSASTAINNA